MNKSYRLIFNDLTNTWVAVAEIVKARGKRASGAVFLAAAGFIAVPPAPTFAAPPNPPVATALPTGGQLVAGQATIAAPVNNALTITQTSQRAAIDWQTFNVGSAASVNFIQPSSSAAILNRVLDPNPSQIFGRINANGQVFLTNSSGIYFGRSASVNVGALTATTHSISNADFMVGNLNFTRNGATGKVENDGNLTAELNGYIALLAPEVRNNGVVIAQGGTVALAAGEAFELQFDGARLANIRVEPATIAALVENGNAVHAPGGLIILSAQAANRLQGGVVNNTGSLVATGLTDNGGTIRLEASDKITHTGSINVDAAAGKVGAGGTALLITDLANKAGLTEVNGTISARGGDLGGDGGFVETSAGRVKIGDNTRIDTRAPQGSGGHWLIDPTDFTVAESGGDISGATLSENLNRYSSATIETTDGNVNINDKVSWYRGQLTINAFSDINVNALMTMNGTSTLNMTLGGNLRFGFDTGGTFKGRIEIPGRSGLTAANGDNLVTINSQPYTVINSLAGLSGMDVASLYVLGSDIDASATSTGAGFMPIGTDLSQFTGVFDGFGHTINKLTINRPSTNYVGLFGYGGNNSTLRNVGLTDVSIAGKNQVGGLVGRMNYGTIYNSFATGTVTATNSDAGGLVGSARATNLSQSHANVTLSGVTDVGGLVGINSNGTGSSFIDHSYANGAVSGNTNVGGLVGLGYGAITNVYATGKVTGVDVNNTNIGGLVGWNTEAQITNAYATGAVVTSGCYSNVGGFVGLNSAGTTIRNAFASGSVVNSTGVNGAGGFAGYNYGSLSNVFSTGNVTNVATWQGALVGVNLSGAVTNAYATGTVNGNAVTNGNIINLLGGTSSGLVAGAPTLVTNTLNVSGSWTTDANWSLSHAPTVFETAALGNKTVTIPGIVIAGDVTAASGSKINLTGNLVSSLTVGKAGTVDVGPNLTVDYGTSGKLNLLAATQLNYNGSIFKVINTLGAATDKATDNNFTLQGLAYDDDNVATSTMLAGNYVMGMDINASETASWNAGKGFMPIGSTIGANGFEGRFDGLGHSVINLSVNNPTNAGGYGVAAGLFENVVVPQFVGNVGLVGGRISSTVSAGGLVGVAVQANLTNIWSSAAVYSTVDSMFDGVGGLIGSVVDVTVSKSHASGNVSGVRSVGGLIGLITATGSASNLVSNSYATGKVSGSGLSVGGLVGYGYGFANTGVITLQNVHANGAVSVDGNYGGGLVGKARYNSISNASATGNVTGANSANSLGGLVGFSSQTQFSYGEASGNVTGAGDNIGGLIGSAAYGGVSNSAAFGNVTGTGLSSGSQARIGGAIANGTYMSGGISNLKAFGVVSAPNATSVGGLFGQAHNTNMTYVSAYGNVTGKSSVGGLIGLISGIDLTHATDHTINSGSAQGDVTGSGNGVGGLVGSASNIKSIKSSNASGVVRSGVYGSSYGDHVGGLIGELSALARSATIDNSSTSNFRIYGGADVGGLIGFISGSGVTNVTVSNSTSSATVNANGTSAGGLIGWTELATIIRLSSFKQGGSVSEMVSVVGSFLLFM